MNAALALEEKILFGTVTANDLLATDPKEVARLLIKHTPPKDYVGSGYSLKFRLLSKEDVSYLTAKPVKTTAAKPPPLDLSDYYEDLDAVPINNWVSLTFAMGTNMQTIKRRFRKAANNRGYKIEWTKSDSPDTEVIVRRVK